jgi:hypothetical protein
MIRITSRLAMLVFDSYKRNGNLTTHQPLPGTNIVGKFWTKSLCFTYEGNGVYIVDSKKKADSLLALPLFEEWAITNHKEDVL